VARSNFYRGSCVSDASTWCCACNSVRNAITYRYINQRNRSYGSYKSRKVKDADFLAQADQKGSGDFREAHRMSSDMPAPMEADATTGESELESLEKVQQKRELKFEEKVLMTVLSWQKQVEQTERKKTLDELQSQFQAKAAMVASLEAQYLQRQQNFSRKQRIKTVDGIQAKQDASAAYLDKFRQKVELYGNRYYPDEAKQQHLSGEVRLMVILNAQGVSVPFVSLKAQDMRFWMRRQKLQCAVEHLLDPLIMI
jgi:tRNA/tmRNA/rRNA uracil-C5-methylase (TrmA/RlmC/RlmD family)